MGALFWGGASNVTRTRDLLITNQLLYQLSYTSIASPAEQAQDEIRSGEYSTAGLNISYHKAVRQAFPCSSTAFYLITICIFAANLATVSSLIRFLYFIF